MYTYTYTYTYTYKCMQRNTHKHTYVVVGPLPVPSRKVNKAARAREPTPLSRGAIQHLHLHRLSALSVRILDLQFKKKNVARACQICQDMHSKEVGAAGKPFSDWYPNSRNHPAYTHTPFLSHTTNTWQ